MQKNILELICSETVTFDFLQTDATKNKTSEYLQA